MISFRAFPAVVATLGYAALHAAEATEPNFIVILTEAQGWSNTSVAMDDRVPHSKSRIFNTPAIERLAREGMRFSHGYAASPRCTPSRAALLTGVSPAYLHMTFVGGGRESAFSRTGSALIPPEPLLELPAGATTVAEMLKKDGYATAHFGKWHLGRVSPSKHGFDESDGATGNGGPDNVANPNPKQAHAMTERGIDFMTRMARAHHPFYLQLSHYPNQDQKGAARQGAELAEAADVDQTVGQLLEALDRLGLTGNTYVLYTSDHGAQGRAANEPLSGGKGFVLEGGLRVPFLVRGPGVAAGVCSHVPVTAMDWLPTIAALAHLKAAPAKDVEGGSFADVLRDPSGSGNVNRAREEIVFHFPHYDHGNFGPATALMLDHYKLIHVYETGARRLYDLAVDAAEEHDLAAELPAKTSELDARLAAYLRAVNAQLAIANPDYDPAKAGIEPDNRSGTGGKGGKRGVSP